MRVYGEDPMPLSLIVNELQVKNQSVTYIMGDNSYKMKSNYFAPNETKLRLNKTNILLSISVYLSFTVSEE